MADTPHFRTRMLALDSLAGLSREMARLQSDKGGIAIMAAKGVHRCILLEQIPTTAANLIKQELLARGGDLVTPWTAAAFSADAVDCIVMGNLITLRSLISKLYRQHIFHLPAIADALQEALMRTTPGYLPVARQPSRQGFVLEETLDDYAGGRIPAGPEGRAKGLPSLAPLGTVDVAGPGQLVAVASTLDTARAGVAAGAVLLYAAQATLELAALAPLVAPGFEPDAARAQLAGGAAVIHTGAGALGGVAAAVAAAGACLLLDLPAPAAVRESRLKPPPDAGARTLAPDPGADWLARLHQALHAALQEVYAAGVPAERVLLHLQPPPGSLEWQRDLLLRRLQEFRTYGRALVAAPDVFAPAGQAAAAVPLLVGSGVHLLLTSQPAAIAPTLAWANGFLRHDPAPPETKG